MTHSEISPRDTAARLVLDHARAPVVDLLHDLGFHRHAEDLAAAPSLAALRYIVPEINLTLRQRLHFGPLRRSTTSAVSALHSAAVLGLNGDAQNAAVIALGAFTNAAHAQAWRRRWWQLPRWRRVRAQVLAQARREQSAYLDFEPEWEPSEGHLPEDPNEL